MKINRDERLNLSWTLRVNDSCETLLILVSVCIEIWVCSRVTADYLHNYIICVTDKS
ncbi:hypothetical protein HanIR_Chr07g0311251 [Helianthus annuus]|nr:hypothetical protein HanIR_Chr07g0311251 [Helianthus annuus]